MKVFSVLNNKLLTIAPTSQTKAVAASCAVLAEFSKTITSRDWLKFLKKFFCLF